MGRPREFELSGVLDRAMRVFWVKGYEGASLDDLLAAMEVGRGSLYKAFGSKHSLYLAALERYDAEIIEAGVRWLRDLGNGDGRARIAGVFEGAVQAVEQRDHSGCFLCNASADRAPHDEDVAEAVRKSMARMEAAFEHALQAVPNPRAEVDHLSQARQLTASYIGFRILCRTGVDVAHLRSLARTIVAGL